MLIDREVDIVVEKLLNLYPDNQTMLDFTTPFELLIATILSAQCTDIRVNQITAVLFKEANTPSAIIDLGIDRLSEIIKSCGMYNQKSKNIMATSEILVNEFNEEVPKTREELMSLPGVGRKTANVVLSNAFGIPAIAVDTHVFRVTNRIGIVDENNVEKTEDRLMERIKKEDWLHAHHAFIYHGRRVCKARNPICDGCQITDYCLYYRKNKGVDEL